MRHKQLILRLIQIQQNQLFQQTSNVYFSTDKITFADAI